MFGLFRRRANAAVPPEVIRARLPSIVWMLAGEYRGARLVANRDHPICKDRQICKDRDTNIMDVWVGTRLEAVSQLWLSGLGKLELIINPRKQLHLLHSILDLHPFFGWPEPTGDDIKDTISSICRVYDYLHRLETETWAPLHEQPQGSVDLTKYEPAVQKSVMEHTAKRAKYEISEYASFIIEMHKLVPKWEAYEFAINAKAQLPDPPETVFGALWRDATFRAKMIALCALLWPAYTHAWR